MAGAVLLVLGVIVGLLVSLLLGALLILVSLGLFGYQTSQSVKAAREREQEDDEADEG